VYVTGPRLETTISFRRPTTPCGPYSPRGGRLSRRLGAAAVGDYLDPLDRDHALADHLVQHRQDPLDLLGRVDDLDQDGQVLRQAQIRAVCSRESAPNPSIPRMTVAPARPSFRTRSTIAW
jgi:hypothetical protein